MSHRVSGSGVWDGSSWVVLAQGLSWLQSSEALTGAVDLLPHCTWLVRLCWLLARSQHGGFSRRLVECPLDPAVGFAQSE